MEIGPRRKKSRLHTWTNLTILSSKTRKCGKRKKSMANSIKIKIVIGPTNHIVCLTTISNLCF